MDVSLPHRQHGHIPRIAGAIYRPRLLHKLETALNHRITLISAPPGYGKTTLVAQFARLSKQPVLWHTVEERERDLPNLHEHAVKLLRRLLPNLEASAGTPATSPSELAAQLASAIAAELRDDIFYVIDDVHHLAGAPSAEAWVRAFVQLVPPRCHLILASRILPDLPLAELVAKREILAIGQNELRFTVDELYDLWSELQEAPPDVNVLDMLSSQLEGWPAGVVLALHPLPPDIERSVLSGGHGPEALFDSLARSLLERQPPGLKDFLLVSSTLARLTPQLCARVLGLKDSADWLDEAQRQSLFLSRTSGGVVYHTLFRNFLQKQLYAQQPDRFRELHISAAQWFEQHDDLDEAFDHYITAGELEQALQLAEKAAPSYFIQGKRETLLRWEKQLGEARAVAPHLLYTCAMIHTDRYEYETAQRELDEAERGFTSLQDRHGLLSVQVQRAMICLQRGQHQETIAQATYTLQQPDLADNLRARALNLRGFALLRLGETESAVETLEMALPLYRADGDAYALSIALQNLETAYVQLGRLEEAGVCLQEVVALVRSLNSGGMLALALNNLGFYYHLRSNYAQAQATFQEGLSVASRVLDLRAESYLLWSLGDLYRDTGFFEDAQRVYTKSLELNGTGQPVLQSAVLLSAAIAQQWQGRYSRAVAFAEEALSVASEHDIGIDQLVAEALLCVARANDGGAEDEYLRLEMIDRELELRQARFERLRILALCATVALMAGDKAGAKKQIDMALQLGKQVGSWQPLTAEVVHRQPLSAFVAKAGFRSEAFVRELQLLRAAQAEPAPERKPTSRALPPTTYSLYVITFGREEIERDGQTIPAAAWRASAARQLFLYLLFNGPKTREDICLVFWPDSDSAQVRSNFHTTLYRARKALGEHVLGYEGDLYRLDPHLEITSDAHEFDRLVSQAMHMPPRDARTEDLWQRAVTLYRGDFLPSIDAEWADMMREEFRAKYLQALIGLGECARARGNFRQAIDRYKRALKVDPYREDVHRSVMTCYASLGEKTKIRAHLSDLEQLFDNDLAVKPSSETVAHARLLMK